MTDEPTTDQPSTETPTTWVDGAAGSLFDLDNLPYGVFSTAGTEPRVGVRIGDHVLDLAPVAELGDPASALAAAWRNPTLNAFMARGAEQWAVAREWITDVLGDDVHRARTAPHLHPLADVELHLPIEVGDYVDFYASEHHASNVGRIFRPDQEPLLPNWKHLPVGYHGRSGTVVASGTGIVRPCGQRKAPTEDAPTYGPSRRLDIEAELGFVVGTPSRLGERVSTADFAAHTFGVVGLNDWSARDVQAWEYVPLGPFLGKSFATSISHWVTPLAALAAAWTDLPGQDPEPLDYLRVDEPAGLDIAIEVVLDGEVVSRPPYASMYWSPAQMLAHTTVNGAVVRTGDLWGSGTVSGTEVAQRGSLLELCWGGKEPFTAGGRERTFLEDGDEVTLRYTAPGTSGGRIALGEVIGRILPAR
jgi:fumarylacetoacetase